MEVIFITRCYKPNNIQIIKNNIKEIFNKQNQHTYMQYLIVDMSYNQPQQNFKIFEDEYTKVIFVYNKKDYYNYSSIDQLIKSLPNKDNCWIYCLDDDNLIQNNFLSMFDNLSDQDIIVFNRFKLEQPLPLSVGQIIGQFDLCMYIVRLNVKKQNDFYKQGELSFEADGKCLQNLIQKYKFKYMYDKLVQYGALQRPLNVHNPNL